jgi:flagellin-specific chaperone FliS
MDKFSSSPDYNRQEVMMASSVRLVVIAYDIAIEACEREDFNNATKTISALRDALDFEYGEMAVTLYGLYQWCIDCIRREEFHEAEKTSRELREAWVTAEQQLAALS